MDCPSVTTCILRLNINAQCGGFNKLQFDSDPFLLSHCCFLVLTSAIQDELWSYQLLENCLHSNQTDAKQVCKLQYGIIPCEKEVNFIVLKDIIKYIIFFTRVTQKYMHIQLCILFVCYTSWLDCMITSNFCTTSFLSQRCFVVIIYNPMPKA